MADINVDVKVSHNHIPQVIAAVEAGAGECAKSIADGIQERASGQAPVLTGALKAGIQVSSGGGNSYQITASSVAGGADREYAEYNEYGTRKMGAQPFMKPGYEEGRASAEPTAIAAYVAKIDAAAG